MILGYATATLYEYSSNGVKCQVINVVMQPAQASSP